MQTPHFRQVAIAADYLPQPLNDSSAIRLLECKLEEEKDRHHREMVRTIKAVQEKERREIGHELHDNINQLLAVAKLTIESLELKLEDNLLIRDRAINTLLMAIEEIRNFSRHRVMSSLEHKDFITSVAKLAGEINQTHIFEVTVQEDGADFELLSCEKKTALFRIIQEQMNNTIKYSKASRVTITLQCKNNKVHLCIKDNGIGFDIRKVKKGVGLKGIYERAGMYNGEASLKTSVGYGCSLFVRIPC
jgi:signal transduction histidine kinase